jgi:hypothetical protein
MRHIVHGQRNGARTPPPSLAQTLHAEHRAFARVTEQKNMHVCLICQRHVSEHVELVRALVFVCEWHECGERRERM